jgi:hypothetical protein
MNESDLLLHFRLIVREEMATFAAQMDARFDHVFNSLEDLNAHLDRQLSELQSANVVLEHTGP